MPTNESVTQTPEGLVYTISSPAGEASAVKDDFTGSAGQNTSYAGSDIVAAFRMPNDRVKVFGSLQTISYSTHRDPFMVRRLGTVNPSGFVVGPRTIAGSMVFTVFDRHALAECIQELYKTYSSGKGKRYMESNHLPDELPPFDVYVHLTNEFGSSSRLAICGIKISDDGSTLSINDLHTEEVFQFVALDLRPMEKRTTGIATGSNGWQDYIYDTLVDRTERYRVDRPLPLVMVWDGVGYVPGDIEDLLNRDVRYEILDLADPNVLYPVVISNLDDS